MRGLARQVIPLPRVRLEVIQLDRRAHAIHLRQHQGVDRALADIGGDVDAGADFEVHDQFVAVCANRAHGLVVGVEGFFGEDF